MILVVGDAMRDIYWHGEVTRLSPEAPVPVLSVKRIEERQGAAANVTANVIAMGVDCDWCYGEQETPVTKIRLMVNGRQEYRVDFDYPQKPVADLKDSPARIVILVDYGKGALGLAGDLIHQLKGEGKTVLVDPKGYDYEKYRGADVIKPNLDEMKVMVGGWKDEGDLTKKAQNLCKEADIGSLLLTRAADGMSLFTKDSEFHIPAVAEKVVDVTGAGETAIAALGVGLHRGLSLERATFYANKAAGIKVSRFGPSVVTEKEVF